MKRYELLNNDAAIKCRICGMTSHHPEDVKNKYCGNCHLFLDDISTDDLLVKKYGRLFKAGELK